LKTILQIMLNLAILVFSLLHFRLNVALNAGEVLLDTILDHLETLLRVLLLLLDIVLE
jgi:hypothetical protein